MILEQIDFSQLSEAELRALIEKAREVRKQKRANPQRVQAITRSINSHVNWILRSIGKIDEIGELTDAQWERIKEMLDKVRFENVREEARNIKTKI